MFFGTFSDRVCAKVPDTLRDAMIASGEVRRVVFDGNAAPVISGATLTPLTGDLLSRSYEPPPGYKELPRLSTREWRARFVETLDHQGLVSHADDGWDTRVVAPEGGRKSPPREDRPQHPSN